MLPRWAPIVVSLFVCHLAVLTAALHADDEAEEPAPAAELAAELLATIPDGSSIALRPLRLDASGLPDRDSDRITDELQLALFDAAGDRATVKERDLPRVYQALEEFYEADIDALLREAQADVEIECSTVPASDSVSVFCKGLALRHATVVATGDARFPLSREPVDLQWAIADLAERIVRRAPATGEVERVMLYDRRTGGRTALSSYVTDLLEDAVIEEMEERRRSEAGAARAEAVLGTARATASEAPRYHLQGSLWMLDAEQIRLQLRLLAADGQRKLAVGADIASASLPPGLADVPSSVSPQLGRMHEGRAEAVISTRLDRKAAERGARNLARARVVAQALGLPAPAVEAVTSESDGVAVLGDLLKQGVTIDERWIPVSPDTAVGGEERVAVRLAARVAPVGGVYRPRVTASLGKRVLRARDPIGIEVRSEESAYVGVFAWGADNRVVRLYPKRGGLLRIAAGEVLVLPRPGDGRIVSEPLREPGNLEDHEAFIVMAAGEPVDYSNLAPAVGATLAETQGRALMDSDFLAALAGLDLGRMTVIVLPYHVYR